MSPTIGRESSKFPNRFSRQGRVQPLSNAKAASVYRSGLKQEAKKEFKETYMEEVDDDRETALAEDGDCKAKVAEELDGYNYLGLGGDGGQC